MLKKIKENLNNVSEIIDINIPKINTLLVYKELSDIFDSTFSLKNLKIIPYQIIEESDYLINKLETLYTEIDNGSLKGHIKILNDYLYRYTQQSHILVNNISNNLKELNKLMKSPKQAISDISAYYSNHTEVSYIQTIKDARDILLNYYQNEADLIIPKVQEILSKFENLTLESIEKQINLITKLNERLVNKEIDIDNSTNEANESDYKRIIANLHNSNNYINKIIQLFKKKVENEMELKNGYFISQHDIESNNETFTTIIDEALEIAQKLDDNEYVDKLFDEIMLDFRQNFIDITKDMELQRQMNFIPNEKSLIGSYFQSSIQKDISDRLKSLGSDIIIKIKKENNLYLDDMNNVVNDFLEKNQDYLNNLMDEINILFSTQKLDEISKSYNESLNRYFSQLINEINQNKRLTYEYVDSMAELMTNKSKIIELLQTYNESNQYSEYQFMCKTNDTINEDHCYNNTFFQDTIKDRKIGKEYPDKYKLFKQKLDNSKEFFQKDFYSDLLNDYKNYISILKETLQSFLNNKMSDKYPKYKNLYFIDNHIEDIKELYNRLNRYISNDIFNTYYYPEIQEYKNTQIDEINNMTLHIEEEHKKIDTTKIGKNKDFCTNFERKRTFTCRNGAIPNETTSQDDCIDSWGSNNLEEIIELSFNKDKSFEEKFDAFVSSLKDKITSYSNLISELKEKMNSIEKKILSQNITYNYLEPIQNEINLILSDKYSDNLLRKAYDYYYNNLDDNLETVFNDISNKWVNCFENLRKKVTTNINYFKYSMNEFGVMALLFEAVISNNLINIFYDSIIIHQKTEYNYTISYYYNCLLQNITSVYHSIYNQIPTNPEGFNNILNIRKKEVEEIFSLLLKIVNESKSESLSKDNQQYILQVSSSNFFNKDSFLSKYIKDSSSILKNKGTIIYALKNGKENNEFSLACRFYLENLLNALQIEEYYQPINEKDNTFIVLNKNTFLELFSDNWIFDQDHFINRLNISIYKSNSEFNNEFLIKKNNYSERLENVIIEKEYSRENISQKISDKYRSQIKEIDDNMKNDTISNIKEILIFIKEKIKEEKERISTFSVSYTNNFSIINNTIKIYKETIYDNLEKIILDIVDDFNEKLTDQAYYKLIEPGLNKYLNKSIEYISECKDIEKLNSSYNIGEIIFEIVEKLVGEYKNFTKKQLEASHLEKINTLKKDIEIEKIKQLIEDELNPVYFEFLNALQIVSGNVESGAIGYSDYDFSNIIENDINIKIQDSFEKIKNTLNGIKLDKNNQIKLIGWEVLYTSFDSIEIDIFDKIKNDFEKFIENKKKEEKKSINEELKNIIKENFNNIINDFIFSFGNEYFERMIKYNENFKIKSLYQNVKNALVISLNYYQTINALKNKINSLTKDLKFKLYNLNNLDEIVKKKNQLILNMLNEKSDLFIESTKMEIIQNYKNYLINDNSIQLAFNESIMDNIKDSLKDISSDLEKDYELLLNEQFKKKFNDSYTKIMNEQANDIINTVNELKGKVKTLFDDLFSMDIEKVLNDTNNQMNATKDSINEYNNHFASFQLPHELIEYSYNYGRNNIKPKFERIESLINKQTKFLTLNNIENKFNEYTQFYNKNEFMNFLNNISSPLEISIDDIFKEINAYGRSEYPKVLENEINKITSIEINEDKNETNAHKSFDQSLNELLDLSKNKKKEFQTNEYFDNFVDMIGNYTQKLNFSYKESLQAINDAFEDDKEVYDLLIERLDTLNNLSIDYYNEIRDNLTSFRNYISVSFNEIDDLLEECFKITFKTFDEKFDNISKEANLFDKPYDEVVEEMPMESLPTQTQFGEFIVDTTIKAIIKKAKFKYSLVLDGEEGQIKKPKIMAIVSNEIKPEQIKFKIASKFGDCGEDYQSFDYLEFNNVNFTMILNYDTESTLINVTTIIDFDKIDYQVGRYKREDEKIVFCPDIMEIGFCINQCNSFDIITLENPKWMHHDKINSKTHKSFVS